MHFLSHKNALKGLQMRCFVVRQKVLTRNQIYALRGGLELQLRPFFAYVAGRVKFATECLV